MAETNTNTGEIVATVETTPTATAPSAQTAKAEDIATAFLNALDTRTQRAERGVVKSFSEQYGMTEDEIGAILAKAKQDKAAQIPEEAQQRINAQIAKANNLLVAADVKAKGATLGLVDVDVAMQLMAKDKIKVADDGTVEGVEEALKALQESKSYLFAAQPTGKTADVGGKIAGGSGHALSGVEAAFLARNPDLKI